MTKQCCQGPRAWISKMVIYILLLSPIYISLKCAFWWFSADENKPRNYFNFTLRSVSRAAERCSYSHNFCTFFPFIFSSFSYGLIEKLMKINPTQGNIHTSWGWNSNKKSLSVRMHQVWRVFLLRFTIKSLLGCKDSDRQPWPCTRQRKDYTEALAPQRDHSEAHACLISHIPWFGWICWCNLLPGMSDNTREPTGCL